MAKKQQSLPLNRKPTHRLYRVLGDGSDANWTPIGAAWPHKDGLGFSIVCDAVPLQGDKPEEMPRTRVNSTLDLFECASQERASLLFA